MYSLTLQNAAGDSIITSGNILGRLNFAVPSESDGTAATYIASQFYCQAEGSFTSASNPAGLVFSTSASDAAPATGRIRISSDGHFIPLASGTYDLGSPSLPFRNLYVDGGYVTAPTGVFDTISFNVDNESILSKGEISWSDTEGSLTLGLTDNTTVSVGETRYLRIRNETGGTLYKGQVVYATGVHSNGLITPDLYVADGTIREIRFMGVVLEDVNQNSNGYALDFGQIIDMDLDGSASNYAVGDETWVAGDILYVHPTGAGKLTKVEPKHSISVAIVLDPGNGNGNGRMFVRPTSYGHLNDNHDVDTSGLLNNQFLVYDSITDYWQPSSGLYYVDGDLGIGTASPSQKLHVIGNSKIEGRQYVVGDFITLTSPSSNTSTVPTIEIKGIYNSVDSDTLKLAAWPNYAMIGNESTTPLNIQTLNSQQTRFGIGTQSSPGIVFYDGSNGVSDNDTGFWHPSSNNIGISTAGLERLRIDSNGNVGIGTVSPSEKLDVNGKIKSTLSYTAMHSATNLAVGWYTVAVNYGNRAIGRFGLTCSSGGRHQGIIFYASHFYGLGNQISVLHNNRYSLSNPVAKLRIKEGGTYDGCLLQVYIDDAINTPEVYLLNDNINTAGWVVVDWVPDGTNPGGVANFAALTNVAAEVDLDTMDFGTIGQTSLDGPVVINEGGSNNDFRVEGDTDQNLLFTDASTDRVGIGTATPSTKLHVVGTGNSVDNGILHVNDPSSGGTTTWIKLSANSTFDPDLTWHIAYGDTTFFRDLEFRTSFSEVSEISIEPSGFLYVGSDKSIYTNRYKASDYLTNFNTAAQPAFTWTNDDDNGMFLPTANNIAFSTAGLERLRIDSNGNVGIGTASPSVKLDVDGQINSTNASNNKFVVKTNNIIAKIQPYDPASATYIGNETNHKLVFRTNNSDRVIITNGGDVGIGVDPPSEKLDVNGTIRTRTGGIGHQDNGCYIAYPGGGTHRTTGNTTGYLKITLPVSWTNTMLAFDIDIYEYGTGKTKKLRVGGYNYSTTTSWINTSAMLDSDNDFAKYKVHFGHDGTNCVIYISEIGTDNIDQGSSTVWSYPQISISNFFAGYSNTVMANWADGWDVGFTTTLGTITRSAEVSRPYRQHDTGYVFNEYGGAYDFRVEGDADTHLLYVKGSAGTDRVGINTSDPQEKLSVTSLQADIAGFHGNAIGPVASGDLQSLVIRNSTDSLITEHYENTDNTSTKVLKNLIRYGADFVSIDDAYDAGLGITFYPKFKVNTDTGAITFNDQFTFPTTDGSAGQSLVTDGSGSVVWEHPRSSYIMSVMFG